MPGCEAWDGEPIPTGRQPTPEPMPVRFAWCFSHGRLHHFDPADPWCTATWVWLASRDEADAAVDKQWRYGNAQFLHDLPADQQFAIIEEQHHA